jgi:hypothetical protein
LKPIIPAEHHEMVLPCASVMVTKVLLNDEFTLAMPEMIFLRSFFLVRGAAACFDVCFDACFDMMIIPYFLVASFLPAIAFAGPLRVRALVCVRWPRTGNPLRWRKPR